MNSGELQFVKAIYSIAKRQYNDSIEPLHPCERPGERVDLNWLRVKEYAEMLIELNKEENNE